MATSPKSNSACLAIIKALEDLENNYISDIPVHIKDNHYNGADNLKRGISYKYPHNYKNNYIKQQYMPESIKDEVYYNPGDNKMEQNIKKYLEFLKEI